MKRLVLLLVFLLFGLMSITEAAPAPLPRRTLYAYDLIGEFNSYWTPEAWGLAPNSPCGIQLIFCKNNVCALIDTNRFTPTWYKDAEVISVTRFGNWFIRDNEIYLSFNYDKRFGSAYDLVLRGIVVGYEDNLKTIKAVMYSYDPDVKNSLIWSTNIKLIRQRDIHCDG